MLRRLMPLAALAAVAVAGGPAAAAPAPKETPHIDVVLCLDVSGSMQGLINSAKTKLWDVVNELGKVQPTPELRVGLYSYGHSTYDAKTGWVRKEADLTNDLDAVYQKLNALTINGGEEYVARVTKAALDQQKWSGEKKALKLIFVAGNEAADQDKQFTLKDVSQQAIKQGVIVNTIYCNRVGFTDKEAPGWREFALSAEGRYAMIDQDKGTVVINAPQDKELAELSAKLNKTYVAYGKDGKAKAENQAAQDKNAEKAGAPAAAARATSKAGGLYRNEGWDLVDRLKQDPKFDIKKVPDDELCDELKKMKPEEREKFVKDKLAEREGIQKQIGDLTAKRTKYIQEETKKNPSKADKAFDEALKGALREQSAAKGIEIPK